MEQQIANLASASTETLSLSSVTAERDQLRETVKELTAALQQCYDHLGWNPAKVPAYVAEDALVALTKARGE